MSVRTLAAIVLMLACDGVSAQSSPTPVVSGLSRTVTGIHHAAWLQGCWESTTPTRSVEEFWNAAKGGSMIGVGRTIRDGKMTAYEMVTRARCAGQ